MRIKSVSKAVKGHVHDKKMYDCSRLWIPKGVPTSGGSGYQGSDLRVPKKKPRKGRLSDEERRSNRRLAKERIAADRYRNPPRRHTVMMKNVATPQPHVRVTTIRGRVADVRLNQQLLRNESNFMNRRKHFAAGPSLNSPSNWSIASAHSPFTNFSTDSFQSGKLAS